MNIKQPGKSKTRQLFSAIALLLLIIAAALPGMLKADQGDLKDTDPMYWMDGQEVEEDLNAIIFTADSPEEGKTEVSDTLTPFDEKKTESRRVFKRAEHPNPDYELTLSGVPGEKTASITYKNASPGDYITVLAVNTKSKEKWCGRVGKAEENGTAEFTLPGGQTVEDCGDYRYFVWTENETKQEAYSPVIFKDFDEPADTPSQETEEEPKADSGKTGKEEKKETGSEAEVKNQARAKQVNQGVKAQTADASEETSVPAVKNIDPMYWMGQRKGGDTNRAMVWFGNYSQTSGNASKPLLWRTLRSDGEGSYGGSVTLLSEYGVNTVWFDATEPFNQHWYNQNSSIGSCDMRAWMNGVGTGAMEPDTGSRKTDAKYNAAGGGAGDIKGSFYANAFTSKEKELIIKTPISGEQGLAEKGENTSDKIFALSHGGDGINEAYFKDNDDRKCYSTEFGVGTNTITGSGMRIKEDTCQWSFRSPVINKEYFWISNQGAASPGHDNVFTVVGGVRPAFNMNPTGVMFTPASNTGGAPGTVSGDLTICKGEAAPLFSAFNTNGYQGGFRVFKRDKHPNNDYSISLKTTLGSQTAEVKYLKATAGDYITVLVVNKENGQKWSGRIGQAVAGGNGTCSFNLPNGQKVEEGSKYRVFAWTENEASGTAYTSVASGDLNSALPYSLTFDGNGGTGTMNQLQGDLKDKLTLPENKFVRAGYIFKEWNTSKNGTGSSYNEEDKISLSKNTTLYAIWKKQNKPTVANTDPMYWMGQRDGGDTNRAMVWFGNYPQTSSGEVKPVLWRTLRSDGEGSYEDAVTLLTEYGLNVVWFDGSSPYNQHWYNLNSAIGSSDMRSWMNGVGTGAMDPDTASRRTGEKYNEAGGGAGNTKGSFYANAFSDKEKELIKKTIISGEQGVSAIGGNSSDKIFALSAYTDANNGLYFKENNDRSCYPSEFSLTNNTITGSASMTEFNKCRWALRSPSDTVEKYHFRVNTGGSVGANEVSYPTTGVRPALNMKPDSVIFTPASDTGGAPAAVSASLTACRGEAPASFSTTYAGGFRVFKRSAHPNSGYFLKLQTTLGSQTADVKYTNAAANDYITVLVVNKVTGQKWSGRVGQVAAGGNGTCTFNLPNGQKIEEGSPYRMFAWTENEAGRTAYTSSVPCGDMDSALPYSLTFDGNGGTGTVDKLQGDLVDKLTLPENKFTRENYIFKEWNTKADGTGTTHYDGDKISIGKDTTLFAIWQKKEINAVDEKDPMYWMGQRSGGDTNRAMVWFGNYQQKADGAPTPVLWRTLRSDGQGSYGGAVTLLTEYSPNTSYFDKDLDPKSSIYNQHWYNTDESKRSSELRAWMNGVGTGAMFPNRTNRRVSEPFNKQGGSKDDERGSFYVKAFGKEEKKLIMLTDIPGGTGYGNVIGGNTTDKLFALTQDDAFSQTYFKDNGDRFCITTEWGVTENKTVSGNKAYVDAENRCKWWTRTPYPSDSRGASVYDIAANGSSIVHSSPYGDNGVRIALNLDPAAVVFTPASETGGAPGTLSATLNACSGAAPVSFSTSYAGGFRVFSRSAHANADYKVELTGKEGSTTATVKYTDASPGDYVTVLAADTTTGRKWSGRIGQVASEGSGTLDFTLPEGETVRGADSGKYRIFAWTENESSKTSYSEMVTETLDKFTYEPSFTDQPAAVAGKKGTDVTLTSEVDGLAPLSYDWYVTSETTATGGTKVGTTSTGSYTYNLPAQDNGKNYYCIVTDSVNQSVTSDIAAITVYYPPTVKTQPQNQTKVTGEEAEFTVEAEGGNPSDLTYQWQFRAEGSEDWENVTEATGTGGTEATLTVPVTAAKNSYEFRCCIGNSQYTGTDGTISETAALTARYQITYSQNYTGAPDDTKAEAEVGTAVTLPAPSREGWEFLGWATADSSAEADAGKGGASYTPTGNITLYGLWKQKINPSDPIIQYVGSAGPFDWSNKTDGQAFIPSIKSGEEAEVYLEYQVDEGDWKEYTGSKIITITDGGISETEPVSGETARIIVKQEGEHAVKVRAVNKTFDTLKSQSVTVTAKLDYTSPEGRLNDGKGTVWDQLKNLTTFGKYYKENVVFTIPDVKDDPAAGVSTASGIKKSQYYIYEAVTEADETDLKAITPDNIAIKSLAWDWQEYTGSSFTVSPDKKFVVYARIEDNAGNLRFIGSDGLIADAANPTAEITQSPAGWTNGSVTLTIDASDAMSGLEERPYSYDGGATYTEDNTSTLNSNGQKTIMVKDKAGNILTSSYTISNIDKVKPDITGFKKHTEKALSSKKMVVNFKVKDTESGVEKVVYGTDSDLSLAAAKEATAGDGNGNTNAGDGYVWYHFETTMKEANQDYYVRAKDKAGNQTAAVPAYEAENLIDVSVPAKMMFAVIPELGGEKDSCLLSPDYEIKNNNNSVQLEAGLSGFKPAAGGKIILTGGNAAKANELNLKAGKGNGAFASMGEDKSLYPLSTGTAKEITFGTLDKAGALKASGTFGFTGSLFDYSRTGSLSQKSVLRSRYDAVLHFSIYLPENAL